MDFHHQLSHIFSGADFRKETHKHLYVHTHACSNTQNDNWWCKQAHIDTDMPIMFNPDVCLFEFSLKTYAKTETKDISLFPCKSPVFSNPHKRQRSSFQPCKKMMVKSKLMYHTQTMMWKCTRVVHRKVKTKRDKINISSLVKYSYVIVRLRPLINPLCCTCVEGEGEEGEASKQLICPTNVMNTRTEDKEGSWTFIRGLWHAHKRQRRCRVLKGSVYLMCIMTQKSLTHTVLFSRGHFPLFALTLSEALTKDKSRWFVYCLCNRWMFLLMMMWWSEQVKLAIMLVN